MQAVPQPHQKWKTTLLAGDLQRDRIRQFGELLQAIHIGGTHLAQLFDDRTYFEALRLEPYSPHALIEETRATRLTVVHGDYSPQRILVYQNRLIPLDHEVIHFEHPAFDEGFASAHFLGKARHLGPSFWAAPPTSGELTETPSKLPPALSATPWPARWPAPPAGLSSNT